MVDLGQASTYAVLSGASVGNTVSAAGAPHTTLRGDLGVKANTQPTGFPPGVVTGTTRVGSAADQAHADLVAAYTDVAARTGGAPLAGALAGQTVTPGLHTIAGAASNTDNGDPRRRERSKLRLRLSGRRRADLRRRKRSQADQRRPGVTGVLAGQRCRRRRRQRQVRGNADGARRGRDGQRDRRQRPGLRPQRRPRRSTTTSSTAPRPRSRSPAEPPRTRPIRPRRSAGRPTSRRRASSP